MLQSTISKYMLALFGFSISLYANDYNLEKAFSQGKIDGQVRALYITQMNSMSADVANHNNSAFALGGTIGYETAPYYGVSAGARFFTTQTLASSAYFGGNPATNTGIAGLAGFFDNIGAYPASSYSILNQVYLNFAYGKSALKIGRQDFNAPLIMIDDIGMIPNMYQGAVFTNTDLAQTKITAAFLNGMMGGTTYDSQSNINPQTSFNSMSRSLLGSFVDIPNGGGASVGNQPLYIIGATSALIPYTNIQAWYFNNPNTLQAYYADVNLATSLAKDWKLSGGVQYYGYVAQGATKQILQNNSANLDYSITGAKINLDTPIGLTPTVAAIFVGGVNNSVYTFATWGSFPEYTNIGFASTVNFASYLGGNQAFGNAAKAGANPRGLNQWKYQLSQDLGVFGFSGNSLQAGYRVFNFSANSNNGANNDMAIWDAIYTTDAFLVKNLSLTLNYENVAFNDSNAWSNTSYSNIKSINYIYLKGMYKF